MNKRQRKALFANLSAHVQNIPGTLHANEARGELTAHGTIRTPSGGSIGYMIFIDDLSPCIHWHSASRRLAQNPFNGTVNQFHGLKATSACRDWTGLFDTLTRIAGLGDAIFDGAST